jgi:hypothetical protein
MIEKYQVDQLLALVKLLKLYCNYKENRQNFPRQTHFVDYIERLLLQWIKISVLILDIFFFVSTF